MSGAAIKGQPRREGPARARALAQKAGSAQGSESATAWLKGSHAAIAMHPEWQKLQAHLQELTAAAVRAHLDGEAHDHPHAIEATRQVTGEILETDGVFSRQAQPHLLHAPYMSAAGATALLDQTLTDLARKVDDEAKTRGTLQSPEFHSFHALVSSIYVGSLQKRAEYVERKVSDKTIPEADRSDSQGGLGIAPASYQACSNDIAEALVAIAMGEGFEEFSTTTGVEGAIKGIGKEAGGPALMVGRGGSRMPGESHQTYGSGIGGVGRGESSLESIGSNDARISLQQKRDASSAASSLQYLSADVVWPRISQVKGKGGQTLAEAQFPGLEWLTPHIIGRSIPPMLRRELWQRALLLGGVGGPSPAEVARLIDRYAGEKGIVDPTNTPIAGMVATGVRHRAAEAFPWLARGGKAELELRQRACRDAEQLLNQYFVFVGKHEARHVASSLVLAYAFGQGGASLGWKKGAGGGEGGVRKNVGGVGSTLREGEGGGATGSTLVAMLHSLSTRFAPGAEDLRGSFRTRAYEEIRKRDAPLFEHLNALFPGYKCGLDEDEDRNSAANVFGDDSRRLRGLIEALLEDAFVGYLREDALLFVWDHLFLLGWREQLPLFVADIALHLRASLMKATVPLTLMSLARDACRRICTRDVREAFRRRTDLP